MNTEILFDDDLQCPKIFKRELKKALLEIKKIEQRSGGKLLFNDYVANGDNLIMKIKAIEKEFKNNSIQATAVQTSRRNHEEDGLINFIVEKDEMMNKINAFTGSFNQLEKDKRSVIYLAFFKRKKNEFIAQQLFISLAHIKRLKLVATENLVMNLAKAELIKQAKINKSKSADLGFLITQKPSLDGDY